MICTNNAAKYRVCEHFEAILVDGYPKPVEEFMKNCDFGISLLEYIPRKRY